MFVGSFVRDRDLAIIRVFFASDELLPERLRPELEDFEESFVSSGLISLMVGRLRGDNERCNFILSKPEPEVGVPGGVDLPGVDGDILLGLKCGLNGAVGEEEPFQGLLLWVAGLRGGDVVAIVLL